MRKGPPVLFRLHLIVELFDHNPLQKLGLTALLLCYISYLPEECRAIQPALEQVGEIIAHQGLQLHVYS